MLYLSLPCACHTVPSCSPIRARIAPSPTPHSGSFICSYQTPAPRMVARPTPCERHGVNPRLCLRVDSQANAANEWARDKAGMLAFAAQSRGDKECSSTSGAVACVTKLWICACEGDIAAIAGADMVAIPWISWHAIPRDLGTVVGDCPALGTYWTPEQLLRLYAPFDKNRGQKRCSH